MAASRPATSYQLHVDLKGLDLMQLVDKVTEHVLSELPEELHERYAPAARAAVERVLREHIVAFDTCGLSAICGDSEPFDPWPKA